MRDKYGFDMNGTRIITTPYADDFNLLTNNKTRHQKIINELQEKTTSMGLTLKTSKCRSLSICSGTPKVVEFSIGGNRVTPVKEDPQKFLGSTITHSCSQKDTWDLISNKFESGLNNIDSCPVRNEFKVAIYERYFLPSMRFGLTVHELTKSNLALLDRKCDISLKKWIGVPKHGANIALVHMKNGLDIPRASDVYNTSHCLAYSRTRCLGDSTTNKALDLKLEREGRWNRKNSTAIMCDQIHQRSTDNDQSSNWKKLKPKIKESINQDSSEYWKSVVEPLITQGDTAKLLNECNMNLTWKSIMYSLPKGVLKFAINAAIDSLPSFTNLYRWGKRLSANCPLCQCKGTLFHILNNCSHMLDRYLWRHNNIIRIIISSLENSQVIESKKAHITADIAGYLVAGGTVPPDVIPTVQKPDIVLNFPSTKKIVLIELTVPFEANIDKSHKLKDDRYASLVSDIKSNGYTCTLVSVEVGSRGLITKANKARLQHLLRTVKSHTKYSDLKTDVSKAALTSSFSIFHSRHEKEWNVVSNL